MDSEKRPLPADTWCNPLALENYPCGMLAPGRHGGDPGGFLGPVRDFRELADPEVLHDGNLWYMFPSAGEAYVSGDLAHWTSRKVLFAGEEHPGYAPTVVRCRGRYLLSSSWPFAGKTEILAADSPLGPYRSLGTPSDGAGQPLSPGWFDPMLFADGDGRLYAYWCGDRGEGIFGMELDPEDPVRGIGKPVRLMGFDPARRFERFGEFNEHPRKASVEGVSMFRRGGTYYLQYSGCGTQFRSYCIGVYKGNSPLGPFTAQAAPAARQRSGRVSGTGHGCWVEGPGGTVWQFYTVLVRRVHEFERRIGMDKVTFDAHGDAHVEISSAPQSVAGGDLGQLPLSVNKRACASSSCNACYPGFAVDDCTHTWWMPEKEDAAPWLEVDLRQEFVVTSFQICWAEEGLDHRAGVLPEAARYVVTFFDEGRARTGEADLSGNARELLVDFRAVPPVRSRFVRLKLTPPSQRALRRGVGNFTVFGHFPEV